jgi:hypothetical protein
VNSILTTSGTVRRFDTSTRRSLIARSQLLPSTLFEKREDHLHANSLDTVDQSILSHSIL